MGYLELHEIAILERKLKLWDTPGFATFIQDVIDYAGVEHDINLIINSLKMQYMKRLKEIAPKSKYIQQSLF